MATQIDLTPQNPIIPLKPITFFNHNEECTISDEEIKILRDIRKLYILATGTKHEISLKILEIRIIRLVHNITLKFSKDIVEYFDANILK
jgi:hypothetical protein